MHILSTLVDVCDESHVHIKFQLVWAGASLSWCEFDGVVLRFLRGNHETIGDKSLNCLSFGQLIAFSRSTEFSECVRTVISAVHFCWSIFRSKRRTLFGIQRCGV